MGVNDVGLFGQTALLYTESVAMIEFLISLGADINAIDEDGETPM